MHVRLIGIAMVLTALAIGDSSWVQDTNRMYVVAHTGSPLS